MSEALSMFRSEGQSSGAAAMPPELLLSTVLRVIGWSNLVLGVLVGGWLIAEGKPFSFQDHNELMIGLGVGLLVESGISCALFHGFAFLVENLTVIRRRLESPALA